MSDSADSPRRTSLPSKPPSEAIAALGSNLNKVAAKAQDPTAPAGQVPPRKPLNKFNNPNPGGKVNSPTTGRPSSDFKRKLLTPTSRGKPTLGKQSGLATSSSNKIQEPSRHSSRTHKPDVNGKVSTISANLNRATASSTSRKPLLPSSDMGTWKSKYEAQLKETQNALAGKEKAEGEWKKQVAEYVEKLTASEVSRERTANEAADVAEQLDKSQADLELSRQDNFNLNKDKDELTGELVFFREKISKLESQATLAGKLQTELNAARRVRIPQLEEENKALKEELRQILKDTEARSKHSSFARARAEDGHNTAGASQDLLHESEVYIKQLEKENERLHSLYTDAVEEAEELANQIATLKSTASPLEGKDREANPASMLPSLEDEQPEKQVLRVTNATPSVDSTFSSVSTQSEIVSEGRTKSESPPSGFLSDIEADAAAAPKLSLSINSTTSIQAPNADPSHNPRRPLDQDLQITINIEAVARAKLTLLQRLSTVTTKGTTFQINGPREITEALAYGMEDAEAQAARNEARFLELQKMMWFYIDEINRMKKAGCNVMAHKNLVDELEASGARLQMQDMLLVDYGRQLAKFHAGQVLD